MTHDLTPGEHEHNAIVEEAARWIVDQSGTLPRPIVELQNRFGLTAKEACEACAMAARMRTARHAFA
jgi:hypothetical protein